jgi:hypothetical protein
MQFAFTMSARRSLSVGALAGALAVALATSQPSAAHAHDETATCAAWDVEYSLAAKLRLEETTMGEGDGTYAIGPGKVVLRFEDRDGQPGGTVNMLSYAMREYFVVKAKTLFWTTTATTDTRTGVTPDTCSSAAEGTLVDHTVRWNSSVRGYHTDGTVTCDGSLCGKFGAPPQGPSPLHIGPGAVTFKPFELSPDMKTFTMSAALVSKTSSPKQTSYLTLAGRETKRTCAVVKPCSEGR